MTITSGNGGFKLKDMRDDSESVLSRNGFLFFLYGRVEIGRKIPQAMVKPNMLKTKAMVSSVLDGGKVLGSLQSWRYFSLRRVLFQRRNLYVWAYQDADILLLVAMQFCFLAIKKSHGAATYR